MYYFLKRKWQTDLEWKIVSKETLCIKARSIFSTDKALMTILRDKDYEVYPVAGTILVEGSAMGQMEVIDYAIRTMAEWTKEELEFVSPKKSFKNYDDAIRWLVRNNFTLEPNL